MVRRGVFCSDDWEKYIKGTIYALGFRSPNDSKEEYKRWLYTHFLLGKENEWKAQFILNYKVRELDNNPVLRALKTTSDNTTVINITGTLNTMVYNVPAVNMIREFVREKNVKIISIFSETMMVNNEQNHFWNLFLESLII